MPMARWARPLDDEAESITPGTSTIMGPDGKIWTFPYNPNFYDREIAE